MSIKKMIVSLAPLVDYFNKEIDPYLGIIGEITNTNQIKEELIITEVLLLMGIEYKPGMNPLRVYLNDNLATDIKNHLLTNFNNLAYCLLQAIDFDSLSTEKREFFIRPKGGYVLEISYHEPMSVEAISERLANYDHQQNNMTQAHAK